MANVPHARPTSAPRQVSRAEVAPEDREAVLGKQWQTSSDYAVTTAGDATGLHVLTARQGEGYAWKTIATLSEPGVTTDRWIGNTCTTGDGKYLVAVYTPRQADNKPQLVERGGFTATVNLATGEVTKLPINASLAYFDPSCGTGHTAVFTQSGTEGDKVLTKLVTVDAATGKVTSYVSEPGQVTSAVPVGDGLIAAEGNTLIHIDDDGKTARKATTQGTAFHLHPTGSGVVFADHDARSGSESVKELSPSGKTITLATAPLGKVGLAAGADGRAFVTGEGVRTGTLPGDVRRVDAPADAEISSDGELAITSATAQDLADAVTNARRYEQAHPQGRPPEVAPKQTRQGPPSKSDSQPPGSPQPVVIVARALRTGHAVTFTASPTVVAAKDKAATGGRTSPLLAFMAEGANRPSTMAPRDTDPANDPVDANRTCSIPRNDPHTMVYQPTPNQVEWAADLAVRGLLDSAHVQRPGNWKDSGLSDSWAPQDLFPLPTLVTGGRIPAQVLLGILAQESNLWQASSHSEPGEYGNPLVSNFYGTYVYPSQKGYDPKLIWKVHWDSADCGYGVGQVTDGMRLAGKQKPGETPLSPTQQRAVAVDYATGIAGAAQILASKWNELHASGTTIKLNNDDPSRIENWFAAAWNYNEGMGYHNGNWGLGWLNNPANPSYPPDRKAFLNLDEDPLAVKDAAHPQYWSYEEKVMGWAGWSIDTGRSYDNNGNQQHKGDSGFNTNGFIPSWWGGTQAVLNRENVEPPLSTFCSAANGCDPNNVPHCTTEDCFYSHLWHADATWKPDCSTTCGYEYLTHNKNLAEPGDAKLLYGYTDPANGYSSFCNGPGGAGVVVVNDIPGSTSTPTCRDGSDGQGTFSFSFPADEHNDYEAKEDLEQDSSGYGGHYYFSHGRQPNNWDNLLETTGTWTPSGLSKHVYLIQAFAPYLGNKTHTADYQVYDGFGNKWDSVVDQSQNNQLFGWITVGYFYLQPGAKVVLTNVTNDGSSGDTAVAYDALMFTPIEGTFQHHTFDAASIFPSNINLDTVAPPYTAGPMRNRQTLYGWADARIHGGTPPNQLPPPFGSGPFKGLANYPACTAAPSSDCIGATVKSAIQAWGQDVTAAGTDVNSHPSIPDWLAFTNPTPPPATIDPDHSFTDDHSYKIKTHIDVRWVSGPDGKVIPGSQLVTYTPHTSDTPLAPFVVSFAKAIAKDYNIPIPDVSFTAQDANVYGRQVAVPNPMKTGITPGKAYPSKEDPATVDSSGKCVNTKVVSGGVLGYRMLDGQQSTDLAMQGWLSDLNSFVKQGKLPEEVAGTAGDFYSLFFRHGGINNGNPEGSLFNFAPPIWQNASIAFCSDGTIHDTQNAINTDDGKGTGLVYQSYMPDLYLYYDGKMVDEYGKPASGPVQRGDFYDFTLHGYGGCQSAGRGNGGNPWDIALDTGDDARPSGAGFCDQNPPPPVS